ncbi:MAG: PQQ-binding-like beta-propeller repeat protein [Limisphaerales bacterium]
MKRFIFALTIASLVQSASADDWTQYRGPNHNGHSDEKLPSKRWDAGPTLLWKSDKYPLGFASFTTSGDQCFTVCGRDGKEVAVAINMSSGRENWSYTMTPTDYGHTGGNAGARNNQGGDGPRSTPTIHDAKVYIMSADLVLYCLDEQSGSLVWKKDIIKEHAGKNIRWKNAASPLIADGRIYVAGGGTGQSMMALNPKNGELLWGTGADTMTHSTPTIATIHGVRQVIFFTQTGLVGVNAVNGTELWRYNFKFSISTAISPIVAGDIVYCSAGYNVGSAAVKVSKAGDTFSAEEIWRVHGHKNVANHWSTPVYKDGYLYGMFSFKKYGDGPLKCVELETGKVVWSKEGFGPGNCIIADGHILALTDDGQVVLAEASPKRYRELSRAKVLKGKCWTTPILSNGRIYVRSTKEAACLDISGRQAAR